jgi:hypothetical protein
MPFGPAKRQAANQQNCLRCAGGGIDNPAPDAIRPHSPNRRGARRNEYLVVQSGNKLFPVLVVQRHQRYRCLGHAEVGSFRRMEARVHSVQATGHRQEKRSQEDLRAFGPRIRQNAAVTAIHFT